MNLRDALILFAVAFLIGFALRRIKSRKKNDSCGDQCTNCSSFCLKKYGKNRKK